MGVVRVVGARAAAVLLVVAVGCGGGEETPGAQAPATPTTAAGASASTSTSAPAAVLSVTLRGGSVEGASRQRAALNQPVTIRVTSDVADEVHVHGYDKRFEVAPGRPGQVTFVANLPGVYEVELERTHKLLFHLEVR